MLQIFSVNYALLKIGVDAGYPDFGLQFPNPIKQSAIRVANEINRGWGKWQIAMFIISMNRLLAKKGKLMGKDGRAIKVDMTTMVAFDKLYEVAMRKLDERKLNHDCVVTRL